MNGKIFVGQGKALADERGQGRAHPRRRQPVQHELPGRLPATAGHPRRALDGDDAARPQPRRRGPGEEGRRRQRGRHLRDHLGQPLEHAVPRLHQRQDQRQAGDRGHHRPRLAGKHVRAAVPEPRRRRSSRRRGLSSAFSAANGAIDHVKSLLNGDAGQRLDQHGDRLEGRVRRAGRAGVRLPLHDRRQGQLEGRRGPEARRVRPGEVQDDAERTAGGTGSGEGPAARADQCYVLLVHGLGRTPLSLFGLASALRRAGHRTRFFGYSPTFESLPRIVRRLAAPLRVVRRGSAGPSGSSGTRSAGCFFAWRSLEFPTLRVHHLVMLGTPQSRIATWRGSRGRWLPFRLLTRDCGRFLAAATASRILPNSACPAPSSPGRPGRAAGSCPLAGTERLDCLGRGGDDRPPIDDTLSAVHSFLMDSPQLVASLAAFARA